MRFDVLTLFPDLFDGYLSESLLKLAIENGLVRVQLHNIRDYSRDKHNRVDDRPFGGGPGMVLMPQPVVEAAEAVQQMDDTPANIIAFTPQGQTLDQKLVEQLGSEPRLMLLCGRYEGFDQRIFDILKPREVSLGDYVLNGGEVAAMVLIDAVIRMIPGVLGDETSSHDDSFSTGNRMLEHAQYTRPRTYRGLSVPEVLTSGDHGQIARWRAENRHQRTAARRPDLLPDPDDPSSNKTTEP